MRVVEARQDDSAAKIDNIRRCERDFVDADAAGDLLARDREGALRRQLNAVKREQFPWMLEVTKCAVQAAIQTGRETVEKLGGKLIMADIITRPHPELAALLPA